VLQIKQQLGKPLAGGPDDTALSQTGSVEPSSKTFVDDAITTRFSCRAFSPRPVPRALLEEIFDVARFAGSQTNAQPWRVYVLNGRSRDELAKRMCAVHDEMAADPSASSKYFQQDGYFPRQWTSPYLERRRANGWGMYGALGIARGETSKMHAQTQRNYKFFDAPCGLIFTIDKNLGSASQVDYGIFLQSVMVAARARGLDTCSQGAWNGYDAVVIPHLGATQNETVLCGMAIGYGDIADPINSYRPARATVDEFTTWLV
jgi:nitroreductase